MYFQTKQWAQRNGARLLKKMKGKGWRVQIHENMGWHFCVIRKFPLGYSIKVYQLDRPYRGKTMRLVQLYHCLFGDAGGLAVWSVDNYDKDPNESVRKQLVACRAYANKISGNVDALQRLVDQAKNG